MPALPQDVVADLRQENARLQAELRAAVDRQAASAEILRAIASAPGDAERALQQIAETTARLVGATSVTIRIVEGEERGRPIRVGEGSKRISQEIPEAQLRLGARNLASTVVLENRQIHIPDLDNVDPAIADWPGLRPARAVGIRVIVGTPLRREGEAIGALMVQRDRPVPLTVDELALLQSFADQAVIAIENARLFNETREALERQDATAEILRTIASAPGDAGRSLQQIAETSARLFGAPSVSIQLVEDGKWADAYRFGESAQRIRAAVPLANIRVGGRNMPGSVAGENRQIHIPDLDHLDPSMSDWPGLPHARAAGTRTMCGTPLRREGKAIGALIVYRDRLLPFTEEELALQQSFADQAVIAIENARLFNATKEALARQTATSDILRVINNSAGNLAPVFDSILENAHHLCGAPCGSLQLYERDRVVPVAIRGMTAGFSAFLRAGYPITEGIREGLFADRPIQRLDMAEFIRSHPDEPSLRAAVELGGIGTMVTVPLSKNGVAFGRIVAARPEVNSFSDKQIALLQGFADQAVIAIENARLFNATQQALERQNASAEILSAIASAMSDAELSLQQIVETTARLFDASSVTLRIAEGDEWVRTIRFGEGSKRIGSEVPAVQLRVSARNLPGAVVRENRQIQIPDLDNVDPAIADWPGFPAARAVGIRAMSGTPLRREGKAIGVLVVHLDRPVPFTADELALQQSFADQAVIAIENARLFNETREALERQTATADILKVIASSPSDVQPA